MLLQLGAKLPFIYHILNFFVHFFGKFFKFHGSFITFSLLADSNFLVFSLLFTYNQHVRNTLHLIVTNLTTNLFIALIHNGTDVISLQVLFHFMRIVVELLADRQDGNLVRDGAADCRHRYIPAGNVPAGCSPPGWYPAANGDRWHPSP